MELAGVVGAMVPIAFIAMIAAIVIVPRYFKSQERQKMAEALKAAIEHGQSLPSDFVETVNTSAKVMPTPARDLRTGIIWMGVALGFAAFGVAIGFEEPDATFPMVAMAAFPGFIGLAFIVLGLMNRNKG